MRCRSFAAMTATAAPASVTLVRTSIRAAIVSCVAAVAFGMAASPASAAPPATTPRLHAVCLHGGVTWVSWEGVRPDSVSFHWVPQFVDVASESLVTRVRARKTELYATTPTMADFSDPSFVRVQLLRRGKVLLEDFAPCGPSGIGGAEPA